MLKPNSDKLINDALENPKVLKYFKIAGVIVSSLIGLYLVGHFFKIGAHTVNGFNDFKKAIVNAK